MRPVRATLGLGNAELGSILKRMDEDIGRLGVVSRHYAMRRRSLKCCLDSVKRKCRHLRHRSMQRSWRLKIATVFWQRPLIAVPICQLGVSDYAALRPV